MPDSSEIRYYVLVDHAVAYLLARVRWPDVCQAISAANPDWLDDMGLFDLPYDTSSLEVSFDQAASIAAGWGRPLHADASELAPSYIRRMPANWSDITPSERHAWGLESVGRRRMPFPRLRRAAGVIGELDDAAAERRNGARVRLGGRAYVRLGDDTLSAGLVDLSERGAGCVLPQTNELIRSGAALAGPLLLELETDTKRICLDVTSRVSWRRTTGGGTHFGVSFTELGTDEMRGVQRFLAVPRKHRTKGIA